MISTANKVSPHRVAALRPGAAKPTPYLRHLTMMLLCLAASGTQNIRAADLGPASVFVQEGVGDQRTVATVAGVSWNLPWGYDLSVGRFGAYVEAAIGRWQTNGRNGATSWPTQLSAIPNLRFHPSGAPSWFAEVGVGPSYIVPLFKSGDKRFSTEFNFDDHIAIGREFGHSELSLRAEHFSNAGISHPNPGENFAQVRYSYRF